MWLPDEVEPVLAGRLEDASGQFQFNYSQDYLERDNAISLYEAELSFVPGVQLPLEGLSMPGCLQDGAPDAWGRRVIINQLCGHEDNKADINELSFMLGSGSDRIGALDFQCSAT